MPRISVIEDHTQLRTLLVKVFTQLGHDVREYPNGEELLRASQQPDFVKPDIIVTDHLMPRVTGLEMLKKFRSQPEFTQVPVIVFSAVDDDVLRKQFVEAGAADYIIKGSIGIKDLEHYLRKHCAPEKAAV